MTISEDVRLQWYDGLFREDTLQVMALLKRDPDLLKVGWGNQAAHLQWKEEPWKERSALHVGVKRGNAELVEHILVLCGVVITKDDGKQKDMSARERKYSLIRDQLLEKQQDKGEPRTAASRSLPDLVKIDADRTNNNDIAGRAHDDTMVGGQRQAAQSTRSAGTGLGKPLQKSLSVSNAEPADNAGSTGAVLGLRKAVSSRSRSKRDGDDKSQEMGHSQEDTTVDVDRRPAQSTHSADSGLGKRLQKSLSISNVEPAENARSSNALQRLRKTVSSRSRSRRDGDDESQEFGQSQEDTTGEGDQEPPKSTLSPNSGSGKRLQKSLSASEGQQVEKTRSSNAVQRFRKAVSSIRRSKREGDNMSLQGMSHQADTKSKQQFDDSRTVREQPQDEDDNKVLRRLLVAKDGEYNLNPIAIAALHGNRKIFLLLSYAMRECKLHGFNETDSLPALDVTGDREEGRAHRAKLREVTEHVFRSCSVEPTSYGASCLRKYETNVDFNFLPWQEYLFHFLVTDRFTERNRSRIELARALWMAIRWCSDASWRFLLELQDGQGRTPLHVAVDGWGVDHFIQFVANDEGRTEEEVFDCAMAACDGAGRTALHRALATGKSFEVIQQIWGSKKKVAPLVREQWKHLISNVTSDWIPGTQFVSNLSEENGFQGSGVCLLRMDGNGWRVEVHCSPHHAAILHGNAAHLKRIIQLSSKELSEELSGPLINAKEAGATSRKKKALQESRTISRKKKALLESRMWEYWGMGDEFRWESWSMGDEFEWESCTAQSNAVELATLLGEVGDVKELRPDLYSFNSKRNSSSEDEFRWPALHIAANAGNYDMLKSFLDDPLCDPYIEDREGNTALHHALSVITIGKFKHHLLDYVSCEHIFRRGRDPREENQEISDEETERQGCINLLLQAGCDIFKTNKKGQPPYPQGKLSKDSKFLSWWYGIQAKEFEESQRKLSSAANAISVTATLVATASYVGPLQPPMGIAGDLSQIQDANLWVRIFIFCDTMSFYLAIVAITLSLIPSIPVPQQRMKDEVQRTRWMVAMSVMVLFPSIIFVLIAFISSSIAVVSADVLNTGGSLTITTASIGGVFCLLTFTLFFLRLLAFIFPRTTWVRKVYNATNWSGPV